MSTTRITASVVAISVALSGAMGASASQPSGKNRPAAGGAASKPLTRPWEQGSKRPLLSKVQQAPKAQAAPFRSQHAEPWRGSSGFPKSQPPRRGGGGSMGR